MKRIFTLFAAWLFLSAAIAQNVGVGTTTPGAKLTVNGAVASTPQSGPAGATITIPANVTIYTITDDGASAANAASATGPVDGQFLTIYNTDGQAVTFAGQTIAASGGVMSFQYIASGWRLISDNQSGGNNFIKNQTASPQSGSGFNTSGNGTIGGTLSVTGTSTLGALTQAGTTSINTTGSGATSVGVGGTGAVNLGNSTGGVNVKTLTTAGVVTNTAAGTLGTLPGTTSTVLHGNAAGAPSFGQVALGSEVSGILPVANGGTGSSTQAWVDLTTNQTTAGNKTWSGNGSFTSGTASTNSTSGAVVVTGGEGISGNLNVGGNTAISGTSSHTGAATFGNTVTVSPFSTAGVVHNNASGLLSSSAVSLTSDVSGVLPVANGGTGSSTQGWVDLTTTQTAGGNKTWTGTATFSNATYSALFNGGNVGINQATPGFPLNFANTLGDKIALWGNSGVHYGFGIQSGLLQIHSDVVGSDVAVGYGSSGAFTENVRFKGNGNVGMGSSAPAAKLSVITTNSDGNVAAWGTGQATVGGDGTTAGALGFSYSTTNNAAYISALSPSVAWRDLGMRFSNAYFYYNGANEAMRINNAGNVSIGGVAPTAQFHTTGTVRFANYTNGLVAVDGTGTLTAPRTITAAVGTTSGTNQLNITNGNGVSGNPTINMHDTYAALLHSNANMTGGGNISYIGGNFNWSNRFIVISNGNGSQFSTSGYFDITQPGSGTITGVGGAGNVTATASGIPLGAWQALYYILPVGSNNGSVAANFRVAQYTSALVVPENWLLLAVVNGDDGTVRVGNGTILQPNQTWTVGSGLNAGWNASVNMISSRDDLNSSGSSSGVPAGFAVTSLVGSGADDAQYGVNLPFTVYIGGVAATWVGISTNGFIQFNSSNSFNGSLNSNSTLPSGSFSIPTFCYYWDDMVTTGNGLRYATIGTSPNRVFVLDFELVTYSTGFSINGQVQIHEGSGEINVRYNGVNAYACGQGATLGLQLTQSIAMPVSCNAKVLDDNTTNTQSMSFSPNK